MISIAMTPPPLLLVQAFRAPKYPLQIVKPPHVRQQQQLYRESWMRMSATTSPKDHNDNTSHPRTTWFLPSDSVQRTMATLCVTASLWMAPAALVPVMPSSFTDYMYSPSSCVVHAKEMASGTGSRVNKDPNSLLRLGLPISNKEVRAVLYAPCKSKQKQIGNAYHALYLLV